MSAISPHMTKFINICCFITKILFHVSVFTCVFELKVFIGCSVGRHINWLCSIFFAEWVLGECVLSGRSVVWHLRWPPGGGLVWAVADSEGAIGEDQCPRAWWKHYSSAASGHHNCPCVSDAFLQQDSSKLLNNWFMPDIPFTVEQARTCTPPPLKKIAPSPLGIQALAYYMVPWTLLSPHLKQYLDRFSLFGRAHGWHTDTHTQSVAHWQQ